MAQVILGMSRVSSKHQITIPQDVRRVFDIKAGQRVMYIRERTRQGDKNIDRLILQF